MSVAINPNDTVATTLANLTAAVNALSAKSTTTTTYSTDFRKAANAVYTGAML